jgi:hypothetical protein
MLGASAEFERAIIQERINAGIARAREKGTKSGKPIGRARVDPKIEDAIRASLAGGKGMRGTVSRTPPERCNHRDVKESQIYFPTAAVAVSPRVLVRDGLPWTVEMIDDAADAFTACNGLLVALLNGFLASLDRNSHG